MKNDNNEMKRKENKAYSLDGSSLNEPPFDEDKFRELCVQGANEGGELFRRYIENLYAETEEEKAEREAAAATAQRIADWKAQGYTDGQIQDWLDKEQKEKQAQAKREYEEQRAFRQEQQRQEEKQRKKEAILDIAIECVSAVGAASITSTAVIGAFVVLSGALVSGGYHAARWYANYKQDKLPFDKKLACLVKREGNTGLFDSDFDFDRNPDFKAPLKIDAKEDQNESVSYDAIFDAHMNQRKTVREWRAMGFDITPENMNLDKDKSTNKENTTVEPQKTTFNPIKMTSHPKTILFNQYANNRQNIRM